MTPDQIHITQSSFLKIMKNSDQFADLLYAELFKAAPELRSIFQSGTNNQKRKLMITLGAAINMLNAPNRLEQILRDLGARHFHYGVQFRHYKIFGTALLKTLATGLAEDWNDEIQDAWAAFYAKISYEMQTGMQFDQCAA